MRKRISLVVGLFQEAGRCVASVPMMMMQPVLTFFLLLLYFVYWVIVLAYLSTAGNCASQPEGAIHCFVVCVCLFVVGWIDIYPEVVSSSRAQCWLYSRTLLVKWLILLLWFLFCKGYDTVHVPQLFLAKHIERVVCDKNVNLYGQNYVSACALWRFMKGLLRVEIWMFTSQILS